MPRTTLLLVALLATLLTGCRGNGASPGRSEIEALGVSAPRETILVGESLDLVARAFDANGREASLPPLSWESSAPAVVSVTENGTARGESPGTAVISISSPAAPGLEASVEIAVREAGEPTDPGLLFRSDWSTAVGATDAALRDTNKGLPWTESRPNGQLRVVSAEGLGFPATMDNVLRVDVVGANSAEVRLAGQPLPAPSAGETRFYRIYLRTDEVTNPGHDHGVELAIGDCAFIWSLRLGPRAGGVSLEMQMEGGAPGTGGSSAYFLLGGYPGGMLVDRGRVYRIEWDVLFRDAGHARLRNIFIYDADGAPLFDAGDWSVNAPSTGSNWVSDLSAHDATIALPSGTDHGPAINCFREFLVGFNGQVGWTGRSPNYRYYGGLEIRTDTFPGRY